MLVDGDVVADLSALSDHAEAVVEEEALADLCAGMDVYAGEEARQMVDQPRNEEKLPFPKPVGDTVKTQSGNARIEEDVPARPRRGIAGFDRIQIGDEA